MYSKQLRCWKIWAVLVCSMAIVSTASTQQAYVGEASFGTKYGLTWDLFTPLDVTTVGIGADVKITNPSGGGLKTRTGTARTFKLSPVTPLISGWAGETNPVVRGRAEADISSSSGAGFVSVSIALRARSEWVAGWGIETKAWGSDPISFAVGSPSTSFQLSETLQAGTLVQAQNFQFPDLTTWLFGRFGIGSAFQSNSPETLWGEPDDGLPQPTSTNAYNLFSVAIRDVGGQIKATVTGADSSPLSSTFSRSLTDVEAQIEDMHHWSLSDGFWKLNDNLDLFGLTVTNNSPNLVGQSFTVGVFGRAGSTAAVPEPSTGLLLATGLVGLLAYGWRRRKQAA